MSRAAARAKKRQRRTQREEAISFQMLTCSSPECDFRRVHDAYFGRQDQLVTWLYDQDRLIGECNLARVSA